MGLFDDQAERLLRTKWSTPTQLAEELYSILTSKVPIKISSPVELSTDSGVPSLTITNSFGGNGNGPGLLVNGGTVNNGPTVYGDNVFTYNSDPNGGAGSVTEVYLPPYSNPTPITAFTDNPTIGDINFTTPDPRNPFTPIELPPWPPVGFPPPPAWPGNFPVPEDPTITIHQDTPNLPPVVGDGPPTASSLPPTPGTGTDGSSGPGGQDPVPGEVGSLNVSSGGGSACVGRYSSGSGNLWRATLYLTGFSGSAGPTVNVNIPEILAGEHPVAGFHMVGIIAVPRNPPPTGEVTLSNIEDRFLFYYQPPVWMA